MKKLLCAIPILLICFMLLLPTVLAAGANSMALTVDSVEGSVGSTVEVAIKASVKNESNSNSTTRRPIRSSPIPPMIKRRAAAPAAPAPTVTNGCKGTK